MERLVLWHRVVPLIRDEDENTDRTGRWVRNVVDRLAAAGGTPLLAVGGTVALLFETSDLEACLDTTLDLLSESEREDPPVPACFGVALGQLEVSELPSGRFTSGNAVDRAQLLSNRVRVGELALDVSAQAAAAQSYLFDRHVATGAGAPGGRVVDRAHPRRAACRPAIAQLQPALMPDAVASTLASLFQLLGKTSGVDRVVLRGPVATGLDEWFPGLRQHHRPSFVLHLEPVPASLEPLGSLRLGLESLQEEHPEAIERLPEMERRTLTSIYRGEAVFWHDAFRAVSVLIRSGGTRRPWVIADAVTGLDPSTLAIIAEVLSDDGPSCLLVGRLPLDTRPPNALLKPGPLVEIPIPTLRTQDAHQVASSVLGSGTADEVVRRIAVLGGTTPLGVLEAARALISAGDLVHDGTGFCWRVGPRSGVAAVPVESLIGERLAALEPTLMRALEVLCVAPPATAPEVLQHAAAQDGLSAEQFNQAISSLSHDALIAPRSPWKPTSPVLRNVVTQSMVPARSMELNLYLAGAMDECSSPDATFLRATYGYFLGDGGKEEAGALALLEAGRDAATRGFGRAALRLAAAAVQFDASDEIRRDATALSRAVSRQRSAGAVSELPRAAEEQPTSLPPTDVSLTQQAIKAFQRRDFENVDRLADTAIAEGNDRAAAERIRALGQLARGDVVAAIHTVARSQHHERPSERSRARGALTRALVLLNAGEVEEAVRSSLYTLAYARRSTDLRAEAAALRVLSSCFRGLGRAEDASLIDDVSPG